MIERTLKEDKSPFVLPGKEILSNEQKLLTADVVYNGVGLPIEDGAVLISQSETVVVFGKRTELENLYPNVPVKRAGLAILPKPANPHTHLDMSNFPYTELPYTRWISEFVVPNRSWRTLDAAKSGFEQVINNIGAFGDIVTDQKVMDFLLEKDFPGVGYWEILDPNPNTADETFEKVKKLAQTWKKRENNFRIGISPHTAHTVSAKLLKKLSDFANIEGLPMQIHLAESVQESELFFSGTGSLANMIEKAFGLRISDILGHEPGISPVQHLAEIGVLDTKPTIIHGVNVSDKDVQLISQAGCIVISCPRSNNALQCGVFPWNLYAKYGVEIALATDSLASAQSLNIFDEVLSVKNINLRSLIRAIVKGGYRALGLQPPIVKRGDPLSSLFVWA